MAKFSGQFVVFGEFQNTPSTSQFLGIAFVSSLSIVGNPAFSVR
jgi:hypothetical protein